MIAEALIAITRHHSPLYRALQQDGESWTNYEKQALMVADKQLRIGIMFPSQKPARMPSIQTLHSGIATPRTVFWTVVNSLMCDKPKLPAKVVAAVGKSIQHVYSVLREAPFDYRFNMPTMAAIGISETEIDMLYTHLTDPKKEKLQRVVNKTLNQLSTKSHALFYMYTNYLFNCGSLLVLPVATDTTMCEKADQTLSNALICAECCSIRSQSKGEFARRSREGVLLDIESHRLYCTTCYSGNIRVVDTRKNAIYGFGVNALTERFCYTACCVCGDTTKVDKEIIGTRPLCAGCYESTQKLLTPIRCLCGEDLDTNPFTITVTTETKECKLVGLCSHHAKYARQILDGHSLPALKSVQGITSI